VEGANGGGTCSMLQCEQHRAGEEEGGFATGFGAHGSLKDKGKLTPVKYMQISAARKGRIEWEKLFLKQKSINNGWTMLLGVNLQEERI